ncbi:hypothetical protein [Sphingorhabdus contaminans]|jgi:hypothetical protein|uniref:Uncharacterized protein n=1 Tax=Sphingorhabdus contaminans TaxID=1343899 RepID=A0A553WB28_9SPHN|nr:hypothetical protein [Sphingorhabdus contaminans]TSB01886.1 hypothetical protein FOM92_12030 [Sphingorhabdus contaminans]
MKARTLLTLGLASAMLIAPASAFAKDERDPGRLPRVDKNKDAPAPAPVSTANGEAVTTQSVDVRDPGSAKVPDKSRDTIRRR